MYQIKIKTIDPAIYGNLAYAKSGIPHQRIKRINIWSWDNHLYFGRENTVRFLLHKGKNFQRSKELNV